MHDIRRVIPENGIVALDNGMYKIWFARNYRTRVANTLLLDNALATMGAGLPSAMMAAMLYPERRVLAVAGDGGFMMNSQEMETAVRLKLNLVVLVLEDNAYGMIRWKQAVDHFADYGMTFGNPDFVLYAKAYGAKGHRIESIDSFGPTLDAAFKEGGVHLVVIPIDYSENVRVLVDELRARGDSIPSSHSREESYQPFLDIYRVTIYWRRERSSRHEQSMRQTLDITGGLPAFSRQAGDFTADRRVLVLIGMALLVGSAGAGAAWVLLKLIALVTNMVWFGRLSVAECFARGHRSRALDGGGAGAGWAGDRPDGAVRLGEDPRPRHSRGDRGDPDRRQPDAAQGGAAEAAILRDLDRHRRPVRRGGPIIMTGGAIGSMFAQCFHLTAAEREDPAGRRRGGGHDRDLRHAHRRRAARGRTVAVRVEAAQLPPGRHGGVVVSAAWRPVLFGSGPLFPFADHAGPALVGARALQSASASLPGCNPG